MVLKLLSVNINIRKFGFIFVLLFQITLSYAQNYRNAVAYVNDFGRNESFINQSMMEYSKTIAYLSPEIRVSKSSKELVDKLIKLNGVLEIHDRGFKNDVRLRDAIMELNTAVSTFMSTDESNFNDYKVESQLSFDEIKKIFRQKELAIEKLYVKFKNYENIKKEFGDTYNIPIKYYTGFNIYEYNTYQNLIFYKINVLDEKLMTAINNRDLSGIETCNSLIVNTCNESLQKTADYKNQYHDETLNNANILFSSFFLLQDKLLIPDTVKFFQVSESFQNVKCHLLADSTFITIEEYNIQVREYNDLKNKFYDTLHQINLKKNSLINNWVTTNSNFLKNNFSFDISDYNYVVENN